MKKISALIFAGIILLGGCGTQGETPAPSSTQNTEVTTISEPNQEPVSESEPGVTKEALLERTLVDGITFKIPESWADIEKLGSENGVDINYFFDYDGEWKTELSPFYSTYKTDDVKEGVVLRMSQSPRVTYGMTDEEAIEYYKSSMIDSTEAEYSICKVGGKDCFNFREKKTGTELFLVPINSNLLSIYAIRDGNGYTRHTEEINDMIDSITIDTSAFPEVSLEDNPLKGIKKDKTTVEYKYEKDNMTIDFSIGIKDDKLDTFFFITGKGDKLISVCNESFALMGNLYKQMELEKYGLGISVIGTDMDNISDQTLQCYFLMDTEGNMSIMSSNIDGSSPGYNQLPDWLEDEKYKGNYDPEIAQWITDCVNDYPERLKS